MVKAYQEREKRNDLRAGVIAATIAEVSRNRKKRPKPYAPRDFFVSLRPPQREQTPEDQRNRVMALAMASGARIKRVPREQLEEMAQV